MRYLKVVIVSFILFAGVSIAHAATWYDKLPDSGEVAPQANTGAFMPNYSGNLNFQGEAETAARPVDDSTTNIDDTTLLDGANVVVARKDDTAGTSTKRIGLSALLVLFVGVVWVALIKRQHRRHV